MLFSTACGVLFEDPFEKGDCLTRRGSGNFTKVSCSDAAAEYVVLDRFPFDEKHMGCRNGAAGTVRTYSDGATGYEYCLGDPRSRSASR
ncbi:LppU/SCO3897 family protein [Nocardia thraciensis]